MDPQLQSQPAPGPYGSMPPGADPGRPFYDEPPPGSSSLSYRPRPDAPNTSYRPPPASEPPVSYPQPPFPSGQGPVQAPSTTSAPSTYNRPQPLVHASPRPMSEGPAPRFDPQQPIYAAMADPISGHSQPTSFPPPPAAAAAATAAAPAAVTRPHTTTTDSNPTTLGDDRSNTEAAFKELLAVRRQRAMVQANGGGAALPLAGPAVNGTGRKGEWQAREVEERLRAQAGIVLQGLAGLQWRVGQVVGRAEGERWRRFWIGGVVASFIPLVKKLFRRPKHEDEESANRTEYAFKKSKSLVSRILAAAHRPGLGTLAFFVFAVLYVFQNEVALRVAKSVSKRLKRLVAKVEDGREELTEHDVKMLQGWRWRVLMWSE
ncbi:hypothetical protein C8A00DRAFT_28939 [Chaetomidium leptoderma]|uniref:Uncharacterized protein n=1 Tax=Chaetomidium leptoderma TaxID=669021 RepID=A0AAN6VWW8_9PEZI|nr:hypothetical protein C8A00DRAFT_28939 [Chaetomidium leptoderma]